jgi:hypothetical protein
LTPCESQSAPTPAAWAKDDPFCFTTEFSCGSASGAPLRRWFCPAIFGHDTGPNQARSEPTLVPQGPVHPGIGRPVVVIPGPDPGIPDDSVGRGDPRIRSGDDDDEKSCLHPHAYPDGCTAKPDNGTSMESLPRRCGLAYTLVPQGPVQLAPGRFNGPFRRVERVTHALPGIVEVPAGSLARPFLMAGSQARHHQGAGTNQQRYTHKNLVNNEDSRNEPGRGQFHSAGHVRVGAA